MLKSLRVALAILFLMLLLTGGFDCSKFSSSGTSSSNNPTTRGVTASPLSSSPSPTITPPVTTTLQFSTHTALVATAVNPPANSTTVMPVTTTALPPTTAPPAIAGVATSTVLVSGYTFSPDTIQVPVGTRVVWNNFDTADHTVTSVSPGIFDNPLPSLGTTSITFTVPGRYDYICSIHPYMTGTVIVK